MKNAIFLKVSFYVTLLLFTLNAKADHKDSHPENFFYQLLYSPVFGGGMAEARKYTSIDRSRPSFIIEREEPKVWKIGKFETVIVRSKNTVYLGGKNAGIYLVSSFKKGSMTLMNGVEGVRRHAVRFTHDRKTASLRISEWTVYPNGENSSRQEESDYQENRAKIACDIMRDDPPSFCLKNPTSPIARPPQEGSEEERSANLFRIFADKITRNAKYERDTPWDGQRTTVVSYDTTKFDFDTWKIDPGIQCGINDDCTGVLGELVWKIRNNRIYANGEEYRLDLKESNEFRIKLVRQVTAEIQYVQHWAYAQLYRFFTTRSYWVKRGIKGKEEIILFAGTNK